MLTKTWNHAYKYHHAAVSVPLTASNGVSKPFYKRVLIVASIKEGPGVVPSNIEHRTSKSPTPRYFFPARPFRYAMLRGTCTSTVGLSSSM